MSDVITKQFKSLRPGQRFLHHGRTYKKISSTKGAYWETAKMESVEVEFTPDTAVTFLPKEKPKSRPDRWNEACRQARESLDALQSVIEEHKSRLEDALSELKSVQEEYEEWRDNMSENLQSSPTYEKLDTVCQIDLEPDLDDLDAVSTAIDEAEGAELPRGYGQD